MTTAIPVNTAKRPIFKGYIPELGGLRAIGICLVILNHMWPWKSYSRPLFLILQLPWMLMDAFFVLSGFLITGILLDSRARTDYYKTFYVRRALRILPIYYAVLIFITAVAVLNGHAAYKETVTHWGAPWWFFVYLGNIPTALTGRMPLAGGGVFVPLWSLQVEEQFYLLFPFLVHRLSLPSLTRVLIGLCCFSTLLRLVLYWLYPSNDLAQYVLLPCRMEGLAMGAWIAIRFRQGPWNVNKRKLTGMVLFWAVVSLGSAAWAGFYHTTPFNRTLGLLLSPLFCAYGIFWLIQFRGSGITAWLRNPVLQYLGQVSYAAYLFHWPVANMLTVIAGRLRAPAMDQGLARIVLIYLMTFGAAALSWQFFENPIASLKNRLFPSASPARPV
jgi:peptidoglycan/LPS O-acetylase OafA/YrhL